MRLEAQAKAGFYPTPAEVVEIIQTWIAEKAPGLRRLLDPCCGTGEPAARIAAAAGCEAYGVEINTERARVAKKLLNKVVAGDLFSREGGEHGEESRLHPVLESDVLWSGCREGRELLEVEEKGTRDDEHSNTQEEKKKKEDQGTTAILSRALKYNIANKQ